MKHVQRLTVFIALGALIGCSNSNTFDVDSLDSGGISASPSNQAPTTENWGASLLGRYLIDPRDCTWGSSCGSGTGQTCAESSLVKVQRTEDTIKLEINITGMVGRNFEGDLNADGTFQATHEFWPSTSFVSGRITDDTLDFQVLYQPDPSKYNCHVQFDYEATPN